MIKSKTRGGYMIPLSIVIAGFFIALAIFISRGGSDPSQNRGNTADSGHRAQNQNLNNLRPVEENDHIRGNPNAPVKIVEYSDFECPFCKRFHGTMTQIMDQYGKNGEVAWVYRHFPLDQLHPRNGRKVAIASECVNEIAGNDAFWKFADRFFGLTPSNDRTNLDSVLPQIYKEIGVDRTKVESCVSSGKYNQHVQDDIDNAILTGGGGTPWSIVVGRNNKVFPLSGAQPLGAVQQLIQLAQ